MPIQTRSSIQALNAPRQPLQRTSSHAANVDDTIIVLSSDDEAAPPPLPRKRPSRGVAQPPKRSARQISKSKAKNPLDHTEEVLEISSDEDEEPHLAKAPKANNGSSVAELRKQLKALKEENARLKREMTEKVAEASLSKSVEAPPEHKAESSKKLLNELDEHLSCEICTLKMWNPFTLQCGHTFCQTCLQDWFNTTLAQYMNTHPHYNPNPPTLAQYRIALGNRNLDPLHRRHLERQIQAFLMTMEHPSYTCPACRVNVRMKPAQVFALKHAVRTVGEHQGESSPKKDPPAGRGRRVEIEDPFEAFFPQFTA
ncbi:hypothetical protein ABKN59_007570 [Abortiporus biennis]